MNPVADISFFFTVILMSFLAGLFGPECIGVRSQRIHHGNLDSIPVPLPLPAQPGYIIIPKGNYNHQPGAPRDHIQRRPPNHPPLPHEKAPPPQRVPNNKHMQRGPPPQSNEPLRRPPISSHVLPQNERVVWPSESVHLNNQQPQRHLGGMILQGNQNILNGGGFQNPRNNKPQQGHQQIVLGPNVKFNHGFPHQVSHVMQQNQNAGHNIPQSSSDNIHLAHFLSEDPSSLLNRGQPQHEVLKQNAHQKDIAHQHASVIFPGHSFGNSEGDSRKPENLILPQTEAALPPEIAHLLMTGDDNIIPDHGGHENFPSAHDDRHHVEKEIVFLNNDVEAKSHSPNKIAQPEQPSYAAAQALHGSQQAAQLDRHPQNAPQEKKRTHEPAYHSPHHDYTENELIHHQNPPPFKPPASRVGNNRILSPQDVNAASHNSDREYHVAEETAPISLYGEVLPANEPAFNNEISGYHGLYDGSSNEPWPVSSPEMPKIINLDVKCAKNMMRISIDFDKPFHGIIYSKGHYSQGRCVHLPAGSGHTSVNFDISINSCGMHGNSASGNYGPTETGSYFENIIIVQYDPLVQEVWDQARRLRCNWHDQYEKTVTFRPFNVDMLHVVRADFAGDNVGCWMQIQVGKGPWASEVSGIVRIGQTMTLVLAIKDDENKFDMLVRNCIAHDGHRAPIELVDTDGCIARPKLMSRFTKVKNFGSSASVLSFAHFQAFKFPDSTDVHIQCTVQICRGQCVDQCSGSLRKKRDVEMATIQDSREVGLNSLLQVIAVEDLTFSPYGNETASSKEIATMNEKESVCMSKSGFAASLILLLSVVIIACLLASFLYLRQRVELNAPPPPYDLAVFKKTSEKETKKQLKELGKI